MDRMRRAISRLFDANRVRLLEAENGRLRAGLGFWQEWAAEQAYVEPAVSVWRDENTALRAAGTNVVKAWQRLGSCEDEFEDYGLAQESCGEYADHLDSAIIALRAALGIKG